MLAILESLPRLRTSSITAEMEDAFMVMNRELFNDHLPVPEFIFLPGKAVLVRWMPNAEYIIIGADLATASIDDILVGLLHEMVHIFNHINGRVDHASNAYHNMKFIAVALEVGLFVKRQKTVGWGITLAKMPPQVDPEDVRVPNSDSLRRRNVVFDKIHFNTQALEAARSMIRNASKLKSKVYNLKYRCGCPPPHNSIRCGRKPNSPNRPNIICQNCGQRFVCVEKGMPMPITNVSLSTSMAPAV